MSKIYYSKTHEWALVDGNTAKIGISNYAQKELGDIVFIDLPSVGDSITANNAFCEVESVKAVSEINAPIDGKIIAVNSELEDSPEIINDNALSAWICEIEVSGKVSGLLDEDEYFDYIKSL
ncbi:MAG TPA: glycine cleavage system protein GcvH [Clostridia bacterium]|nr:glycine cleavage system protein GcvH [Clostridia bacterium]